MTNNSDFQEQVKRLGKLIAQFDNMPDGSQKTACKELVQLLMDVHGMGLERMMEVIFESGNSSPAIIDKLGQDSIAGSLLLLYSFHPDDLETRVHKAMEKMRPRLRKLSCSAELKRVVGSTVQVQLMTSGHSCGSSTKDLKAIVEDSVYEFAPDVMSLEVLGLEEPSSAGFVALDSLLGHNFAVAVSNGHAMQSESAD